MVLDVRHLRLVESVAEHGSLTRASAFLHLTQSALSHQLRDLEDSLGATLFHRSGKRMIATHAGLRLLETAKETLRSLERAESEMRRLASGREAVLRLTTECYTCYHWLPRVLGHFRKQFPHVDVRVDVNATQRPVQALLAGEIDLAIVLDGSPDQRVRLAPLFRDENVVVMPPGHRFEKQKFVEAQDLEDEPLFLYSVQREESTLFTRVLNPAGVNPRHISYMQLTEAIVELVKGGLGVTVLARWAVDPHVRTGALVVRPLGARGFHRRWFAATLSGPKQPEHSKAFVELIKTGPGLLNPGASRRTPAA